jgi:alkylation response protein AidB-like acyl-CoA dehydrogenase
MQFGLFELTEDQKRIQNMVREFAQKEVAPGVRERDEKQFFDRALINKIGALGINGIMYPKEYGGSGGDYLSYLLALEELCKVDDAVGMAISVNASLYSYPVFTYGTEEQKQKYLRPVAEGTHMGSFALTEPSAGTDAAAQQTTAVLQGDHYLLNGSKMFITNSGEDGSEFYVVFAMTGTGLKGISAFMVEKGTPGLIFGRKLDKMGLHATQVMELFFENMKVPKENLLGKEGDGFKIAMSTLDGGRIGIGAQTMGVAQAALDACIKYSKERIQFGKPIANNQVIAFMMADMATAIEAGRLLMYHAAKLKMAGKPYAKEAAMTKMFTSDAAMKITTDAVQIFGGYGYMREYPLERLMRNVKITQIYEGTNQVQRMVISGAILR